MIWNYDKVLIAMDFVCSHNVLNLAMMFKDPGAQVKCFWVLNVWLLVVKYLNLLSPRILLSSLKQNKFGIFLFHHNIFVSSLLQKLKSHVLIIRHTPSANLHILGRIVSNPWDGRSKKNLKLPTVAPGTSGRGTRMSQTLPSPGNKVLQRNRFDLNRANKKCILMRANDFYFATQARIRSTANSCM